MHVSGFMSVKTAKDYWSHCLETAVSIARTALYLALQYSKIKLVAHKRIALLICDTAYLSIEKIISIWKLMLLLKSQCFNTTLHRLSFALCLCAFVETLIFNRQGRLQKFTDIRNDVCLSHYYPPEIWLLDVKRQRIPQLASVSGSWGKWDLHFLVLKFTLKMHSKQPSFRYLYLKEV